MMPRSIKAITTKMRVEEVKFATYTLGIWIGRVRKSSLKSIDFHSNALVIIMWFCNFTHTC